MGFSEERGKGAIDDNEDDMSWVPCKTMMAILRLQPRSSSFGVFLVYI